MSPTAPVPASARSVIETDTFCEACGFNLMTQPVWRDEALGLLVCRCPECGRHHAAQGKTTIGTAWLHRLGTLGLVAWVGLVLLVVTALFFGMIGNLAAAEELLTWQRTETLDGVAVQQTWDPKTSQPLFIPESEVASPNPGKTIPASQVRTVRRFVGWLPGGRKRGNYGYGGAPEPAQALVVLSIFAAGIVAVGAFLSSVSWHWRGGRRWAWLVLPLLSYLTVLAVSSQSRNAFNGELSPDRHDVFVVYGAIVAVQLVFLSVGLLFGRMFARAALLLFLPPKARQVFAFLWLCDGRTPPQAKASFESTEVSLGNPKP